MGGMGGGTGGMSGGMFSVPDTLLPAKLARNAPAGLLAQQAAPATPSHKNKRAADNFAGAKRSAGGSAGPGSLGGGTEPDYDSLIDLITSTIMPTTWDSVGGPGSIMPANGTLVISQTQAVHEEIENLLANLRAAIPGLRAVTIRAVWLQLDLKQLDQLLHGQSGKAGIDRNALYEMAGKTKGYLGAITCLSGQTVHIASGRSRTAITGAVPVVGDGGGPGYQPVTGQPLAGALLQVTPQLLPNTQGVMLDLCSSVTRAVQQPETIHFYSDDPGSGKKGNEKSPARGLTLDRVNMVVSQLATSIKLPLDEPTLVGGLTTETPTADQQAADSPQLYLFVEASSK
jgi:hypothetical protein